MSINKQWFRWLGVALAVLILVGCGGPAAAPTATLPAVAAPTTAVPTIAPKTGTLSGRVHLVSPPTPAMTVYALDQATGLWASVETKATDGEASFTITVQPGSYKVFAFSANSGYAGYSLDGWTLADVAVSANQTVTDVNVRPPSQSECGSMFGVPASPDQRFAAVPGPTEDCKAKVLASLNTPSAPTTPQRVAFAPGAISSQAKGSITKEGEVNQFVLTAMAGQEMTVNLDTWSDPLLSGLYFVIEGQDGTVLVSDQPTTTSWTGKLPTTQDYTIEVRSVAKAPVNYSIEFTISAIQPETKKYEIMPLDTPVGFETLYGLNRNIMLPPSFPVADNLPLLKPYVLSVGDGDYDISLDFGSDCHGAGACHYGSMSGKKVASNQPESTVNFVFDAGRAKKVALAKDITGYYLEGQCGASCDDSRVFWIYDGFQYMFGLKGASQNAVIDLANATLNNSLH